MLVVAMQLAVVMILFGGGDAVGRGDDTLW